MQLSAAISEPANPFASWQLSRAISELAPFLVLLLADRAPSIVIRHCWPLAQNYEPMPARAHLTDAANSSYRLRSGAQNKR